jgi:hypothetical protein
MSNKQPPRVQLNFEPDYEPPPHAERNRMIDIDIKDVDLEAKEETLRLAMMPKVEEKEEINEKDIFDAWRPGLEDKILSEQSDDDIIDPTPRPLPKKQTINRVNKKPRKQMTEAHKAKLAEARKKALEVRRAKAQEKKQAKHIEQETKILKQKQKLKEFEQLKQEVEQENQQPRSAVAEREPEPHRQAQSPQVGVTTFTKKDLEDAQFDAILKYDALRKKQKAEKKQAEMVERQKKELLNKIAPQQYRYRDGSNPWDRCY